MDFDEIIERRGTHSFKWDKPRKVFDVPADNLPMWIADTDFRLPDFVLDAGRRMLEHGILGYGFDTVGYLDAIAWWLDTRHGWRPEREAILTANGLCNAIALCLDAYTAPGDGVVTLTPVYPEFESTIMAAGRHVVQCELARDFDRYVIDFDRLEARMTGTETALLFCSPHNPVGRVWTRGELDALADFVRRHDLLLMSDEIHADLVYPGARHIPMTHIEGLDDRLIMLTAATKTFTMPGLRVGNMIVRDRTLRMPLERRLDSLHQKPTTIGPAMIAAALTPEGALWADALVAYLDGNRRQFEAGVNALPGLRATPIEGTFLEWVDFSGTGMSVAEFTNRVERAAGIAASRGTTFGPGGESFLRFNIGTQRTRIDEALDRLGRAFADLQ